VILRTTGIAAAAASPRVTPPKSETAKVESLVEHDTDQSELMNTVAGVGGPSIGVNRSGFGATMSYWMIATASGG